MQYAANDSFRPTVDTQILYFDQRTSTGPIIAKFRLKTGLDVKGNAVNRKEVWNFFSSKPLDCLIDGGILRMNQVKPANDGVQILPRHILRVSANVAYSAVRASR